MEELLHYLNSIHPLSEKFKEYLAEHLKTKKLSKKDFLLKSGHVNREMFFISRGLLRCFYMIDDKEVSSWFMKEGDVAISVKSFYQQAESNENIQALEDSLLHYITSDELHFLYRTFPEVNIVARVLTEKYYTLSEERLYAMRLQKSIDRYNYLRENHGELILRVPSKFIASYLGITEVTLSNIKSKF